MTQRLWPQLHPLLPPSPLHHLLLAVSPPMGEEEEEALCHTPHSPPPSSSAPTPSPISPSQTASLPNNSTNSPSPPPPSAPAAKIPFRPRKLRKISDATEAAPAKSPPSGKQILLRVLPRPLTFDGEMASALRHLRAADPHLAHLIDAHDPPVFQNPHPPFHSLARSILYQQLAFKAAASIYARFVSLCGGESGVLPEAVLALTPHQLRQIGVSGRKASYLHDLARKYHNGILSDAAIIAMDDKSLFSMLTMVKGIGAWSVHMFMIFSLHRPDVLPVGDLGVRRGVQILYGLDDVPRPSQMDQLCERWRPYRSVAAWYMWRLVEARGSPTITSLGVGALPVTGTAAAPLPLLHQHPQQPQIIDPIQMLPNIG